MRHTGWYSSARVVLLQSLIAISMVALPSSAHARRNANGAMLVHTDNSVIYTYTADYCASVMPTDCGGLNANATGGIDFADVVWLVAAFRPEASPGVTMLQFGIEHNLPAGQGYIPAYGPCGPGPIELKDLGWPETGFGDLVAFSGPVFSHVFQFYWFAVFVDPGGTNYFGTRTYPSTNEATFVDDGNPPLEDLCTLFGTVRWDGTGFNNCPPLVIVGACCYPDGTCRVQTITDCQGNYVGDGTVCTPSPCPQPEACCFCDGSCQYMIYADCVAQGGLAQGPGTDCEPAICASPPDEGACCLGQECVILTRWCCSVQNGEFEGDGTVCDPNPCLWPAACCFCDGTCQMLLEADCLAQDGLPFGPGSECEAIQCAPPPVGACCFSQECVLMDERCCSIEGGVFKGSGTPCDPNPCEETPVHSTTWGRIKASYR